MSKGNFGDRLKRERELREVTLQEITSATRIGPRFLEALENEEWEKLPGGVFNRGFVRSIARYLGLDEEVLLGEYDLAHGEQAPPAVAVPEERIPAPSPWFHAALVLGALVLLAGIIFAGIYAWRRYAARHRAQQTPAAIAPAPSQATLPIIPASTEVPAATGNGTNVRVEIVSTPLDLLVSASAATHLLVLADGKVAFYDEMHAGENRHFTANDAFEVTAADSGAVLLELNGQAMPPLGVPGSSGTIKLSHDDLRQAPSGNPQR
jgi:cytoskeleton protein RodZ